jgi:hypothetical protein
MAILLQVKWVDGCDQAEPHQRIRQIGGESRRMQWKHTQEQAIESIEQGLFAYYVEKDAHPLKVDVAQTADGKKYLIIRVGDGQSQLPLDLPAGPIPQTFQRSAPGGTVRP